MTTPRYIHMNGALIPYADAKVHIQAPAMKFGIGVFEGVRGYWNPTATRCSSSACPNTLTASGSPCASCAWTTT